MQWQMTIKDNKEVTFQNIF